MILSTITFPPCLKLMSLFSYMQGPTMADNAAYSHMSKHSAKVLHFTASLRNENDREKNTLEVIHTKVPQHKSDPVSIPLSLASELAMIFHLRIILTYKRSNQDIDFLIMCQDIYHGAKWSSTRSS